MPVMSFELDVSAEHAYRLLTDLDFLSERRRAAGDSDVEISIDDSQSAVRMRIESTIAPELPAFARKLFARWIKVIEVSEWSECDGGFRQKYETDVAGGAGTISGTTTIAPRDGGCVLREEYEGTVHFPMLKGRLHKLLCRETERTMHEDFAYLARAVTGPR